MSSSLGFPLLLALFPRANRPVQVFPVANVPPRPFLVATKALILHEICLQAFPWPRHSFTASFLSFCPFPFCFPSLPLQSSFAWLKSVVENLVGVSCAQARCGGWCCVGFASVFFRGVEKRRGGNGQRFLRPGKAWGLCCGSCLVSLSQVGSVGGDRCRREKSIRFCWLFRGWCPVRPNSWLSAIAVYSLGATSGGG